MRQEERLRLAVGGQPDVAGRWLAAEPGRPTVLYLHGFGSSQAGEKAAFFRRRAVAEGQGFLSIDFRGHGESGGGMLPLTLSRCLEDAAAARSFLTARGVDDQVLMGSSMGALVGLWSAALDATGIVAGLYIAPALELARDLARLLGANGIRQWRESGAVEFENELGRFEVGWDLYQDLGRYPTERLSERLRVRSLIFQGRQDDRVAWRSVEAFVGAATGPVTLRLFDDGDHRLLDRRDEIWRHCQAFLAAEK